MTTLCPPTLPRRIYLHRLPQIRALLREGNDDGAAAILLWVCAVMERHAAIGPVAPWYYEQLANIYRRQDRTEDERAVLERFMRLPHGPGVKPARLEARLRRLAAGRPGGHEQRAASPAGRAAAPLGERTPDTRTR